MDNLHQIVNEIDEITVSRSMVCLPEECSKYIHVNKKSLSVLHLNIRSINRNFDEFLALIMRIGISCDILILTECWLSKATHLPEIEHYICYSSDHTNQNDGVVLYIKLGTKHTVDEPPMSDCNCLVIKCDPDSVILAIYRSPSASNALNFLTSLNNLLTTLAATKNITIVGDININIAPGNEDPNADEYLNLTASHGLLPAYTSPTREISKSCIDHVIMKSTSNKNITLVLDTHITDHTPVLLHAGLMGPCKEQKPSFKSVIDYNSVSKELAETEFSTVLSSTNANQATDTLVNIIQSVIKRNTKVVKITRKNRIIKPWVTVGALRCLRHRDKLHRKSKIEPDNIVLKISYNRYRNFCTNLLRKLKREYERQVFDMAQHNPKVTWNAIKKVANIKAKSNSSNELLTILHDPSSSINFVNNFFVNVGKTLAMKFCTKTTPTNDILFPSNHSLPNSMVLLPTDYSEIELLVMGLRNDCATGWDQIPSRIIKDAKRSLIPPILYICNLSMSTGTFPSAFKKAVVHPIYKSGARSSVDNYRPISVLSTLSKIFEKVLNNRLTNFLENQNAIACNQYGFRKGISTEDAVLDLTNSIVKHLDHKNKAVCLFLDLSKAFDTVSVPLLLAKMEDIGVRGIVLEMFKSYLSDRVQCVKIDGHYSEDEFISYGVPQGSVLGPTLFLIYIDKLCRLTIPNCEVFTYADDTALLISGRSWELVHKNAESALKLIMIWLADNVLTLNLNKTKFITFSPNSSSQPPSFGIVAHTCGISTTCNQNCLAISRTTNIKYLGVYLDDTMSWNVHLQTIVPRLRKLIYVFKTLRTSASPGILKMVYYALAQSLISYCITIWGGTFGSHMIKLERTQRCILKVMHNRPYRYPTSQLFADSSVLTVRQLFVMQIILRKHSQTSYDPRLLEGKRLKHRVCPIERHRLALAARHYHVLSARLYNKVNQALQIYHLSTCECKAVVQDWLKNLTYNETENLFIVLK